MAFQTGQNYQNIKKNDINIKYINKKRLKTFETHMKLENLLKTHAKFLVWRKKMLEKIVATKKSNTSIKCKCAKYSANLRAQI